MSEIEGLSDAIATGADKFPRLAGKAWAPGSPARTLLAGMRAGERVRLVAAPFAMSVNKQFVKGSPWFIVTSHRVVVGSMSDGLFSNKVRSCTPIPIATIPEYTTYDRPFAGGDLMFGLEFQSQVVWVDAYFNTHAQQELTAEFLGSSMAMKMWGR